MTGAWRKVKTIRGACVNIYATSHVHNALWTPCDPHKCSAGAAALVSVLTRNSNDSRERRWGECYRGNREREKAVLQATTLQPRMAPKCALSAEETKARIKCRAEQEQQIQAEQAR